MSARKNLTIDTVMDIAAPATPSGQGLPWSEKRRSSSVQRRPLTARNDQHKSKGEVQQFREHATFNLLDHLQASTPKDLQALKQLIPNLN